MVHFLFGVRKEEVGLAAVLFSGYGLIFPTSFLHFPVNWISMVVIVPAGLWVLPALAVRRG